MDKSIDFFLSPSDCFSVDYPPPKLFSILFFGSFTREFDYFPSLFLWAENGTHTTSNGWEINSIKSLKLLFDENEKEK